MTVDPTRQCLPVSRYGISAALDELSGGLPTWLVDECLVWAARREARGEQFTGGHAVIRHWLDDDTKTSADLADTPGARA